MINNNSNNVINFTSLTGVRKKKDNKASLNKYEVSLYETLEHKFFVRAKTNKEAEEQLSEQYCEQELKIKRKGTAYSWEVVAELVEK